MAIPDLIGFDAGENVTAAKLTEHTKTAIEESVYYKPICRIRAASAENISNLILWPVVMATVVEDTDGMAIANDRIEIQTAGIYRITLNAGFAANATGFRRAAVNVEGVIAVQACVPTSGSVRPTRISASDFIRCEVGDTLMLSLEHNAGVTIATAHTESGVSLSAEWVSL